jgi:diacylglycerol kinase family enzyme
MDKVTARRARVVEAEPIDAGDIVELDVDGEALGILPARFEIVPGALRMIVPGAA